MKKVLNNKYIKIISDILIDALYGFLDIIGSNLRNIILLLSLGSPYLMWYICIKLYEIRGKFTIGGEIFIPIFIYIIVYFIKQFANRIGRGENIPIPENPFIESGEEEGEYTIETDRIDELILYMAKLESYLKRKGLLR